MKRYYVITIAVCLVMLIAASFYYNFWEKKTETGVIKVGFLSENDELTASTYNFFESESILEKEFPGQIEIISRTNVREDETTDALQDMVYEGCRIIFANTRNDKVRIMAQENPDVQFCQITNGITAQTNSGGNFHTFNAKVYQGQYVSGVAAGMKLREMIDTKKIQPDQALVGYIASLETPETISGFTAFILGIRSVAPEATMRVHYLDTLSNFRREKINAKELIDEGCVIIAQNSGSSGPAAACQEAASNRTVYYVGYNDRIDEAFSASLIFTRTNWDPYIVNAVKAVLLNQPIESTVIGEIHGNDICAGFDQGWIEVLDLNESNAAKGTNEQLERVIDNIIKGKIDIFKGDYIAADPKNMRITVDLNNGFAENSTSSEATFRYILRDVITVEPASE